jgi:hemerythrin
MAFMEWDDTFSVGVVEIDGQHKRLIGMVNEFYESIKNDHNEAFARLLDSLIEYAVYHFTTEEKYMDQFGYPGTESHKEEHRLFKKKILDVKKRFEAGSLVLSLEITTFLKDWIAEHVRGVDKRYSKCFNDNGLR